MPTAVASAPKTAPKSTTISLPRMAIETMAITLVGDTPLICHAWSDENKAAMLAKQMGKAESGRPPKNPEADFLGSLYKMEDGGFGFPLMAFKKAITSATRFVENLKMTEVRGAVHLIGGQLVPLETGEPVMREDIVRLNGQTADLRYRAEFRSWKVNLLVKYNANAISQEEVLNLFQLAGFAIGIGDWRPENNGTFGCFHISTEDE